MKLPVIQRFQKNQYSDAPDWFTRFIQDLNSFTEIVWNILNKNITFEDNIDAQVYTFNQLGGTNPEDNTLSFKTTLKHSPVALIVGQATNLEPYSTPGSTAVGLTWSFAGDTITISSITGLTAGDSYQITVVAF